MLQNNLPIILLDQSKDPVWMIDAEYNLLYANKSYFDLIKKMTGIDKQINETVFVESDAQDFTDNIVAKWKAYYQRAFKGEYFEIEEHYFDVENNDNYYTKVTFTPLKDENSNFFAISCQSEDVTQYVGKSIAAQKQIEERELFSRTILENNHDCLKILSLEGDLIYMNHNGLCAMEIDDFSTIKNKKWSAFWNSEQQEMVKEAVIKARNGETTNFNGFCATTSGKPRWWDVLVSPIGALGEPVQQIMSISRDITEIVLQDQQVLQEKQRYKALVQEGSDLIAIVDSIGNYKYVSPSCATIFGMATEEFLGRNTGEFIHPEDLAKAFECLNKLSSQKTVKLENVRFKNHKNEWRWMEAICTNLTENPAVDGIVINARDVTYKVENQQRLLLLESVITNMQRAVLITEAEPFDDPGPRIIFVNEAFTKMTGYSAEEVISKTPRFLQGPNSDKAELAKLSTALKKWEPCEISTINYKKNGEEFWVNFSVSPIANEKGFYTHWIAIERDVTKEKIKSLEKELLAKISLNFNSENDYLTAAKELCTTILNYGNFDLVEVWATNLEKSKMRLISYFVAKAEDEIYYENQQQYPTRKISEGLVGEIWQKQTELLWDDLQDNNCFLRRNEAKKIGLKAVLGIPLVCNNDVVGVLMIGTKKDVNYLKIYGPIFKQLEIFIGSELSRKRLENDLSNLYNTIPDVLIVLNKNGQILKINQAGCLLTGYQEEEMLLHSFSKFIHPDDAELSTQIANRVSSGEDIFGFENRCLGKEGDTNWLSWNVTGDLTEAVFYATAKNINEEKKLRELNRQANNLAKIGSWEVNLINQSVYWSDFVHQLHETDPENFVPEMEMGINFYREDFRQLVKSSFEKCISTQERFDFEVVIVTSKMKEVWVRVIGNGEFVDGLCKRIYGSFQNIDEIKNTENRLLSLAENLPGVIYQYTIYPDGTDAIDHVSGAIEQLWGYTKEEVLQDITQLWEEINLGGDIELVKSTILQSIETKARWTCRYKIVKPNGELKTHFGNGVPVFMADGSIVFNVMIIDITQEAKNEALLNQASEMSRIGSWEKDLINHEDESMYWSPMIKEILGVQNSFVPTVQNILEFCVGESKERLQEMYFSLVTEGIEYDEELLFCNLQGQERWVRLIGKREIANNKVTRIYGSFQDIDERKRVEENLLRANERFEKVTEATNDAIWDWDIENKTIYRSKAYENFFGKDAAQSVDLDSFWQRYFHPDELHVNQNSVYEAIEDPSRNKWELEYKVYNEFGETLYVVDRGLIIRNNAGKAIRMVGTMTNVTEQKLLNLQLTNLNKKLQQHTDELERSNEELEQFAFVASHDLQEPLRMISSFMDLLKSKYGHLLDEKGHKYIFFATDGAKRMKSIILDLLEYSKANKSIDNKEEVDFNKIITEYKLLRSKLISETDTLIINHDLPSLITYKAVITQVFHCLIDNALKYSARKNAPIITISATDNDAEWEFSIKDNGIGIEAEFFSKIFIIFQRLHNANDYAGTGIGLSIAKRHVEFLGGRIWLQSTVGEGSTFYFTVPKN